MQPTPVPPTIVQIVPEVPLPIARDTTSKEAVVIRTEVLPAIVVEQVAAGYKKPLEIRSVSDIPQIWTLEEMEQWFASLPYALPESEYHSGETWENICRMHTHPRGYTPFDIILTYGFMMYCDPYWMVRDVNIRSVASRIEAKNEERKRKVPESRIFAEMGIALLSQDMRKDVPIMPPPVEEYSPTDTETLPVVQNQQPFCFLDELPAGTKYADERRHLLQIGVYYGFCDVTIGGTLTEGSQGQWETWAYDLPDAFFGEVYQAACEMAGEPALD